MPYINTKLSVELSKEDEARLARDFGEAITLLPGKTEKWLMLNFEGGCRMYFAGTNDRPTAMVEVELFGKADSESYARLTARLTELLVGIGIPAERVYIKYEEIDTWGWSGENF